MRGGKWRRTRTGTERDETLVSLPTTEYYMCTCYLGILGGEG